MIAARLLADATATLESVAVGLLDAPRLHRAFGAWLAEKPAPDDILAHINLQPAPRSYEWVSLAALAEAAGWPIGIGLVDAGLEWLSLVALTRVEIPAPVATDGIAQIALALAIRRRSHFRSWFDRVLTHAPSKCDPAWAAHGASIALGRPDGLSASPALRLALKAVGVGHASLDDQNNVLDMLMRAELTEDPLLAVVLLRALELIRRAAVAVKDRRKVFISYNRKDAPWLERLQVHLKPLEREGLIDRWDDTRIAAGEKWRDEIDHALANAGTAVFLVSANFLNSDFIQDVELPKLLDRAEVGGVRILPVIVGPCLFERSALAQFKAVNVPAKPLSMLQDADQDMVLVEVARAVLSRTSDGHLR